MTIALLLAACQDGDTDAQGDRASKCDRFALLENDDWELREAVDRQADDVAHPGDPDLDWYSEFERFVPLSDDRVEGVSLVISGHDVAVEDLQRQLTNVRFRRHPETSKLLVGSATNGPSIVLKRVSDSYTLRLLSYGLEVDELVQITAETRPACKAEWVEAQSPL